MRITRRGRAMSFSIALGVCLVGVTVALQTGWIILNWRRFEWVVIGIPFFALLIVGLILNTIFLVREVRRNEQQDSFINAVTHELKTPITSIRLYLDTMRRRDVTHEQQQEFFAVMSEDTDRLMATVEQVLKAGELGQRVRRQVRMRVDMDQLVQETVTTAMARYHLPADAIRVDRRELQAGSGFAVAGNPEELRTAVLNIIDNAVKYSPDGAHLTVVLSVASDA
jgi:two-component system, OmpR family, sensor histidine kinase SenX3